MQLEMIIYQHSFLHQFQLKYCISTEL